MNSSPYFKDHQADADLFTQIPVVQLSDAQVQAGFDLELVAHTYGGFTPNIGWQRQAIQHAYAYQKILAVLDEEASIATQAAEKFSEFKQLLASAPQLEVNDKVSSSSSSFVSTSTSSLESISQPESQLSEQDWVLIVEDQSILASNWYSQVEVIAQATASMQELSLVVLSNGRINDFYRRDAEVWAAYGVTPDQEFDFSDSMLHLDLEKIRTKLQSLHPSDSSEQIDARIAQFRSSDFYCLNSGLTLATSRNFKLSGSGAFLVRVESLRKFVAEYFNTGTTEHVWRSKVQIPGIEPALNKKIAHTSDMWNKFLDLETHSVGFTNPVQAVSQASVEVSKAEEFYPSLSWQRRNQLTLQDKTFNLALGKDELSDPLVYSPRKASQQLKELREQQASTHLEFLSAEKLQGKLQVEEELKLANLYQQQSEAEKALQAALEEDKQTPVRSKLDELVASGKAKTFNDRGKRVDSKEASSAQDANSNLDNPETSAAKKAKAVAVNTGVQVNPLVKTFTPGAALTAGLDMQALDQAFKDEPEQIGRFTEEIRNEVQRDNPFTHLQPTAEFKGLDYRSFSGGEEVDSDSSLELTSSSSQQQILASSELWMEDFANQEFSDWTPYTNLPELLAKYNQKQDQEQGQNNNQENNKEQKQQQVAVIAELAELKSAPMVSTGADHLANARAFVVVDALNPTSLSAFYQQEGTAGFEGVWVDNSQLVHDKVIGNLGGVRYNIGASIARFPLVQQNFTIAFLRLAQAVLANPEEFSDSAPILLADAKVEFINNWYSRLNSILDYLGVNPLPVKLIVAGISEFDRFKDFGMLGQSYPFIKADFNEAHPQLPSTSINYYSPTQHKQDLIQASTQTQDVSLLQQYQEFAPIYNFNVAKQEFYVFSKKFFLDIPTALKNELDRLITEFVSRGIFHTEEAVEANRKSSGITLNKAQLYYDLSLGVEAEVEGKAVTEATLTTSSSSLSLPWVLTPEKLSQLQKQQPQASWESVQVATDDAELIKALQEDVYLHQGLTQANHDGNYNRTGNSANNHNTNSIQSSSTRYLRVSYFNRELYLRLCANLEEFTQLLAELGQEFGGDAEQSLLLHEPVAVKLLFALNELEVADYVGFVALMLRLDATRILFYNNYSYWNLAIANPLLATSRTSELNAISRLENSQRFAHSEYQLAPQSRREKRLKLHHEQWRGSNCAGIASGRSGISIYDQQQLGFPANLDWDWTEDEQSWAQQGWADQESPYQSVAEAFSEASVTSPATSPTKNTSEEVLEVKPLANLATGGLGEELMPELEDYWHQGIPDYLSKVRKFVINLPRSKDRLEAFFAQEHTADFIVEQAVYGKMLSPEQRAQAFDKELFEESYKREPTMGEIGCTLSHWNIYQEVLNNPEISDDDWILVTEDDTIFFPNWYERTNQLLHELESDSAANVKFLQCNNNWLLHDNPLKVSEISGNNFWKFADELAFAVSDKQCYFLPKMMITYGSSHYLFKKSLLRKRFFLENQKPYWVADDFPKFFQFIEGEFAYANPMLSYQDLGFVSIINEERVESLSTSKFEKMIAPDYSDAFWISKSKIIVIQRTKSIAEISQLWPGAKIIAKDDLEALSDQQLEAYYDLQSYAENYQGDRPSRAEMIQGIQHLLAYRFIRGQHVATYGYYLIVEDQMVSLVPDEHKLTLVNNYLDFLGTRWNSSTYLLMLSNKYFDAVMRAHAFNPRGLDCYAKTAKEHYLNYLQTSADKLAQWEAQGEDDSATYTELAQALSIAKLYNLPNKYGEAFVDYRVEDEFLTNFYIIQDIKPAKYKLQMKQIRERLEDERRFKDFAWVNWTGHAGLTVNQFMSIELCQGHATTGAGAYVVLSVVAVDTNLPERKISWRPDDFPKFIPFGEASYGYANPLPFVDPGISG